MTRLIFIRHGQSEHNVDYMYRGLDAYYDVKNTDSKLTSTGVSQAKSVRLEGKIDVIYCSPLKRCRDTLCIVKKDFNDVDVFLDDRLMEPQGEAYCNKRSEKSILKKECPATWNLDGVSDENPFERQQEGHNQYDVRFKQRVIQTAKEIHEKHAGKTIAIFTHHDWISVWFKKFTDFEVSPRNCEVLFAEI
jgi:broad specificity phosphatase PhoE